MPRGELFDGAAHRRLGYHRKLHRKPSLEPGQRFITGSQHTGVFEHAAQMVDRFVRTGFVEAGMGQRDRPAGQAPQQFLDSGRAFPGQDAGGPVDPAQRLDDRGHSFPVVERRRSSTRSGPGEGRTGHRFRAGRSRLRFRSLDR